LVGAEALGAGSDFFSSAKPPPGVVPARTRLRAAATRIAAPSFLIFSPINDMEKPGEENLVPGLI
jgi:hypothetical protein